MCGLLATAILVTSLSVWVSSACFADSAIGRQEAISIAARCIGLGDLAGLTVTVERVVPAGDRTPFLSDLVNGRKCYAVRFSGLEIKLPLGDEDEEIIAAIHGLNALIDAESGKLFRVWSTERLDPPSMKRSPAEVADRISRTNDERWLAFPDAPPSVALLRALYHRNWRVASLMEQLDAYYVVSERTETDLVPPDTEPELRVSYTKTRTTWQIVARQRHPHFWGIAPLAGDTEPFPVYGCRLIVDAETGEALSASNLY
jgi:hypothetical protein